MMICRQCGWPEVKVIDSRSTDWTVKRRRRCTDCGYVWNTYEVTEGEFEALEAVQEILSVRKSASAPSA